MNVLAALQPPRWPDVLVFGPPLPDGAEKRVLDYLGPARDCAKHPGVETRGGRGGCWACEAAT